jgi:hypothetical protein
MLTLADGGSERNAERARVAPHRLRAFRDEPEVAELLNILSRHRAALALAGTFFRSGSPIAAENQRSINPPNDCCRNSLGYACL